MVKPIALANAAAGVGGVAFAICGLLAYIAPDLLLGIANSWFHALNLEAVRATTQMPLTTFIFGVVSFVVYIWVIFFAGGYLYNKLAK
ncbi:MAG: DUF5676 family membrane protein [Patescibacteria group bacterium]